MISAKVIADSKNECGGNRNANGWSGNFRGFIQYRKMFNNENITK